MRIALDIDGTITRHIEFFSVLSQCFIGAGHEVFVLTNRSNAEGAKADLDRLSVHFTKLITFADYSEQDSLRTDRPDGWKGRICEVLAVDVVFDDSIGILSNVNPNTCCFWVVDHSLIKDT